MGTNITHKFYIGDVLDVLKTLPDESVHCCVTSPPYWGLRDYGVEGQLGLEPTPEEYVNRLVEIFREVWRVLRDDGTLWLNLGDSYYPHNGTRGNKTPAGDTLRGRDNEYQPAPRLKAKGLKAKDLVGIPWRVAFALQADGWYLRSDIIWAKTNPMPESVKDRVTRAHEYLFLLAKSKKYFYDADVIREPHTTNASKKLRDRSKEPYNNSFSGGHFLGRNKRSVWTISTKPFKDAHFAVFPPDLVEPCIKAGTSEKGCCPKCGAPWKRMVKDADWYAELKRKVGSFHDHSNDLAAGMSQKRKPEFRSVTAEKHTVGWRPTCSCGVEEIIPCMVLDPFGGAGTTNLVAAMLGKSSIYIDLNPEYAEMAIRRLRASNKNNLFEGHVVETINIYPQE